MVAPNLFSCFCIICKAFQDLEKIPAENGFHFEFNQSPTDRKRQFLNKVDLPGDSKPTSSIIYRRYSPNGFISTFAILGNFEIMAVDPIVWTTINQI